MTPSNQKAFSDEDLRQLKEIMKVPKLLSWLYRPNRKLEALLARLEAAEKFPQILAECHDLWLHYKKWIPQFVEAYEAWEKAAGKV